MLRLAPVALAFQILVVGALFGWAAPATAAEPRPAGEVDPERRARTALRAHLTEAEVDRLFTNAEVNAALVSLMAGWDGVGDTLTVARRDGRLVLDVVLRTTRCSLALETGHTAPELPRPEPVCDEVVAPDGQRSLDLDPRLWEPPRPRPPRPKPSTAPPPPGPTTPEPASPWGEAPIAPPTVLRELRHPESPYDSGLLTEARIDHERLRERLARPGRHDPLLPRTGKAPAMDAAEALAPLPWAESPSEPASAVALRNPFGDGRMRTDLPVPIQLTLPGSNLPPLMPTLTEDCEAQWRLRERSEHPPELDCYRSYAWHKRLDNNDAYRTLEALTTFLDIPLARSIMAVMAEDVKTSRAHELVWAFVWLEWVGRAPDDSRRIAEALASLAPDERRYLRKQLATLWGKPDGLVLKADAVARGGEPTPTATTPAYKLITRLYERHFLDLYPEAKDLDGLPRRNFVTDTWLWANNWLAVLDGRSDDAIERAYHRLPEPERRVIDAFVREPTLASRWARVPQVIARL